LSNKLSFLRIEKASKKLPDSPCYTPKNTTSFRMYVLKRERRRRYEIVYSSQANFIVWMNRRERERSQFSVGVKVKGKGRKFWE
jgi:hypothetical protein